MIFAQSLSSMTIWIGLFGLFSAGWLAGRLATIAHQKYEDRRYIRRAAGWIEAVRKETDKAA